MVGSCCSRLGKSDTETNQLLRRLGLTRSDVSGAGLRALERLSAQSWTPPKLWLTAIP